MTIIAFRTEDALQLISKIFANGHCYGKASAFGAKRGRKPSIVILGLNSSPPNNSTCHTGWHVQVFCLRACTEVSSDTARDCDLETHFRPMESWCHLFARKFAGSTAEPLVRLYSDEWAHNVAIFRF